jgi:hypothetical protein
MSNAANRKIEEIRVIVAKRKVLRDQSSMEDLLAEIEYLEQTVLESRQAAMISQIKRIQENTHVLINF